MNISHSQQLFVIFWVIAPIALWIGMLYGDYLEGQFVPFWKKKKKGVNSGAKFG
jgi:hypothetical protein